MSIISAFTNYIRDRRALEQLRRLDDRMLADIGLRGADLKAAVKSGGRPAERATDVTQR